MTSENLLRPSTNLTFTWYHVWPYSLKYLLFTPGIYIDHLIVSINVYSYMDLQLKYCPPNTTSLIYSKSRTNFEIANCRFR